MTTGLVDAESITLEVHGTPAPQGSKTAFVRNGRAIVTEGKGAGRQKHAAWRQAVATAARDWQDTHRRPLLDEPVQIEIEFWLPKPKSKPAWKRWPDVKPDLDKLVRSVFDSLEGLILAGDSRVVDVHAVKRYAVERAPGCQITIVPLGADEQALRPQRGKAA